MRVASQLRRARNESFDSAALQVVVKDPIWIKQVAYDQIEAAEVFGQLRWKRRFPREERGERPVFDGANRIRIETPLGERDDVLVPENLDVRLRKVITQEPDRRQGE